MVKSGTVGTLTWQLFRSHLLVALAALALTAAVAFSSFVEFHRSEVEAALLIRASLVADVLDAEVNGGDRDALQAKCRALGGRVDARITVIAPGGEVLADSRGDPARMDNHAGRPEIRAARLEGTGSAVRHSDTLRRELFYAARRIGLDGPVVRLALQETEMAAARRRLLGRIGLFGLAPVALAAALGLYTSRRITRPLVETMAGAQRLADGELGFRLAKPEQADIAELVDVLNRMAERLDRRVREVQDEREEENAVLMSMTEGVIAVDADERIIKVNRAAFDLMRVPPESYERRTMQEVFRHAGLLRFLARILAGEDGVTGELVMRSDAGEERMLLAHGSVLRDPESRSVGALAVLQDVSRLRKLETMRREFVANVSHELKTPVTSIQGFVETLLDGAMDEAEEARKFLGIIQRQTLRIHAIIQDLLTLSQLEDTVGKGDLPMERIPLRPVLERVVQLCEPIASERGVTMELMCADALEARMNVPLIEQALFNLLENAIKYGREGGRVVLEADEAEGGIRIRVHDEGEGIASEHLERIFERFYRVDRARSRDRGGSGLGLSIVKHIAQAHGGRSTAQSTVGSGSMFTIFLPLR